MPFRLRSKDGSLADGLRRIAEEQLIRAASALEDRQIDPHEAVHEVRKHCKRLRAVLRLVRDGLHDESIFRDANARYRSLAKELSGLRDATAQIEVLDDLSDVYGQEADTEVFKTVRHLLVGRRDRLELREDFPGRIDRARVTLTRARRELRGWTDVADDFDSLAGGLETALRRATRAMRRTEDDPRPESYHRWRKRVNDHRHHCHLLSNIFEGPMQARRDVLGHLAARLGQLHDLGVLEATLRAELDGIDDQRSLELLLGLIKTHSERLRAESHSLGAKLFCEKPRHFVRRSRVRYDLFRRTWSPEKLAFEAGAGRHSESVT